MSDSFSDLLKILSSYLWDLVGKLLEKFLCTRWFFTLVPVFVIAVGSGRGDGAANFAELDSDFSEPGKHV